MLKSTDIEKSRQTPPIGCQIISDGKRTHQRRLSLPEQRARAERMRRAIEPAAQAFAADPTPDNFDRLNSAMRLAYVLELDELAPAPAPPTSTAAPIMRRREHRHQHRGPPDDDHEPRAAEFLPPLSVGFAALDDFAEPAARDPEPADQYAAHAEQLDSLHAPPAVESRPPRRCS